MSHCKHIQKQSAEAKRVEEKFNPTLTKEELENIFDMIDGKNILAIVPARMRSKRLKMKNIKIFKGKPLFIWALNSIKWSDINNIIKYYVC